MLNSGKGGRGRTGGASSWCSCTCSACLRTASSAPAAASTTAPAGAAVTRAPGVAAAFSDERMRSRLGHASTADTASESSSMVRPAGSRDGSTTTDADDDDDEDADDASTGRMVNETRAADDGAEDVKAAPAGTNAEADSLSISANTNSPPALTAADPACAAPAVRSACACAAAAAVACTCATVCGDHRAAAASYSPHIRCPRWVASRPWAVCFRRRMRPSASSSRTHHHNDTEPASTTAMSST